MVDTMATPGSYRVLPVATDPALNTGKPRNLSDIAHPEAISSNSAKSLTHHLVRDQEAGGSNPLAPTNSDSEPGAKRLVAHSRHSSPGTGVSVPTQ